MTERRKVLNLRLLGIFTVFVCLLLSGCGRRTRLKDGFVIVDSSDNVNALVDPDKRVLLGPNVINVVDNEKFIIGLREDIGFGPEFLREEQYGYFIYDKATDEIVMELSQDELAELS